MSATPTFNLVWGVDDYNPDVDGKLANDFLEKVPIPCQQKEWKRLASLQEQEEEALKGMVNDFLTDYRRSDYHGNPVIKHMTDLIVTTSSPERGLPNVLGLILDRTFSPKWMWALAACEERFANHGYMIVPKRPVPEWVRKIEWWEPYESFSKSSLEVYTVALRHLIEPAVILPDKRLKLIVYWRWS